MIAHKLKPQFIPPRFTAPQEMPRRSQKKETHYFGRQVRSDIDRAKLDIDDEDSTKTLVNANDEINQAL